MRGKRFVTIVARVSAFLLLLAGIAYGEILVPNPGTLHAWGYNLFGQLGDGTTTNSSVPVVSQIDEVTGLGPGSSARHTVVIRNSFPNGNEVWAWGRGTYGQLGNGANNHSSLPVQVSISSVVRVARGSEHTLARKSDGTVWTWGRNSNGQLGDNTITDRNTPVQVNNVVLQSLAVDIDGGGYASYARKSTGEVCAWGKNDLGQLGDGTTTERHTPTKVLNISTAIKIAGGGGHGLAVLSNGGVKSWGYNGSGGLGDGTTTTRLSPVSVKTGFFTFLMNATAVASGNIHSLALKSDGTVWAWGENVNGQIGDGTNTDRLYAVQVVNLTNVIAIAAGSEHSLALKSDGTVWAWGRNDVGQLGNGSTANANSPVQVSSLSNITIIASGSLHGLAAN